VIGTATTVAEAKAWESVGADLICAQGAEAGAHRGTFFGDFEQSSIGLMALLPQVTRAVTVPVIAAGGIMSGTGIAAALILGAEAAQLGTAFLCCPESGIHEGWKKRIQGSSDDSTRLTRVFSGRHARGIVNDFMEHFRPFEKDVPPYPIQNALTAEIRKKAASQNRLEMMSLWAGQGSPMARALPAEQLVETLADELDSVMDRISSRSHTTRQYS
jgi:nitronate monooxygenase